jgi:sugar (pentulose or hexulose) kinase
MNSKEAAEAIIQGNTALGIEFGSTRIKAVLTHRGKGNLPLASGVHDWENRLESNIWTYSLEDIHTGLQDCYQSLAAQVQELYHIPLTTVGAIGISGMMHGYMPFDREGNLLVPFRTWRNTMTEQAANELSHLFSFQIPQRWSIAHLYQACLNQEPHVKDISYLTTLAGYVHWQLTGEKVMGVGEASGMFPIDSETCDFHGEMLKHFDQQMETYGFSWKCKEILPTVLPAGAAAGHLTLEGAKFLDPTGTLQPGIPFCPPEGDAGTGMAATNSVKVRTGNVSAGTSIFAMVVLEEALSDYYPEIDMVTTPDGSPVAMVHCNNGTSDLNAWVGLFEEFASGFGGKEHTDKNELFGYLYRKALEGEEDCGGLLAYNYVSGEPVTGLEAGRPMFVRQPDANFTLANFMRTHLYASLATLKIGLDILSQKEQVKIDSVTGHGGFFKTPEVGQKVLAAAMNVPITVMETAGEGGPWGMALLAAYLMDKKEGETLDQYLQERVFAGEGGTTLSPEPSMAAGFEAYLRSYRDCLAAEKAAAQSWK